MKFREAEYSLWYLAPLSEVLSELSVSGIRPQPISLRYEIVKADMQHSGKTRTWFFDHLRGTTCSFCQDGTLVAGEYKGNDAMICESCETPAVQLW